MGASICGNYTFGANFANDSTTTWGPGTAVSRTIGGDDAAAGAQQSIASLNGMATISWVGTTLVLTNATCTGICTTSAGGFNNGQQLDVQPVRGRSGAGSRLAVRFGPGSPRRRSPAGHGLKSDVLMNTG